MKRLSVEGLTEGEKDAFFGELAKETFGEHLEEEALKRLLMAEQWDSFARAVLPKDAPAVQRQEMRRAFYAGAQGILFGVIAILAPEAEPTDEDIRHMENLHQELQDFANLVEQGRA